MRLYNNDCLIALPDIPDNSVDMVFADLPYGTTQNKWDTIIPFEPLWEQLLRVGKHNTAYIFTATQPFTSMLVMSNLSMFKYEIIWQKTIGSGQLNIKHQPLRKHESILVFYANKPIYNEQKTEGKPYKINRRANTTNNGYGTQTDSNKDNNGYRHATSVITISNPRIEDGHPTQKPVELLEYLIKTYSNPGNVVLDPTMGSGSTGIAALSLGRDFIGIEKDAYWFNIAQDKIIAR